MSPTPVTTTTPVKKRVRKSRAKGLRAKTGCLTCRKRHLKCGEQKPVCEHCQKSDRVCTYPNLELDVAIVTTTNPTAHDGNAADNNSSPPPVSPSSAVRQRFAAVTTDDHDIGGTIGDIVVGRETTSIPFLRSGGVPTPPQSFTPSQQRLNTASPLSASALFRSAHASPQQLAGAASTSSPFADIMMVSASPGPRIDEDMPPPMTAYSPANTDSTTVSQFPLSADLASIRWLGLLATDAANVSQPDVLAPFGSPLQTNTNSADQMLDHLASILPMPYDMNDSEHHVAEGLAENEEPAVASSSESDDDFVVQSRVPERRKSVEKSLSGATILRGDTQGTAYLARIAELGAKRKDRTTVTSIERGFWHEAEPLQLQDYEIQLFRHWVENLSQWMDLFDPLKHFSTMVTRLATHNLGLMKAILALSARHVSLSEDLASILPDRNIALQYYYETLHYLQAALNFETYTRSPELNATAIIISKYEMLDGTGSGRSGWERHLKGIFWIQRSQNINGDSGGIKSAVWWEWLRQDVWVAFRERRRVLSFWKPQKTYASLDQHGLANRASYLLSQAVNFCANEEIEQAGKTVPIEARTRKADSLMKMCCEWKQNLGDSFQKLPTLRRSGDEFEPVWLHPPQFGVALQLHSLARILIILHRPSSGGIKEYMALQGQLSEAVELICGIAMTQTDDASRLISSQCVFGAGLCIREDGKRKTVLDMLDTFRARTHWPTYSLSEELKKEWAKG